MLVEEKINDAIKNDSRLLNLSGFGIETIPDSIFKIKNLQVLNLSNNKIRFLEPFRELPNLQVIHLDNNKIEKINSAFFDTINLVVLYLSGNELVKIPDSIGNQKKLKRLFLTSNNLSDFPTSITNLESLEILEIANNKLRDIPTSINNLKKLVSFSAYDNKIERLDINFMELRDLQNVNLANNSIQELPQSLPKSNKLKHIQFYSNRIEKLPSFEKSNLPDCELNLADNLISGVSINNSKIKKLHLYFNPIKGNQLGQITKVKIDDIFIDLNQTGNFIIDNRTIEAIKIINNRNNEIRSEIYKTVPSSIAEKYGLKSKYQSFREKYK